MFPVHDVLRGQAKKKVQALAEDLQLQAGELAWMLWQT
jgi:hypothetical protein